MPHLVTDSAEEVKREESWLPTEGELELKRGLELGINTNVHC